MGRSPEGIPCNDNSNPHADKGSIDPIPSDIMREEVDNQRWLTKRRPQLECIHVLDMGGFNDRLVKLADSGDAVVRHLKQQILSLEQSKGVHVVDKHGKFEYHLQANGKDTIVAETDSSELGLKRAEKLLDEAVSKQKAEIEKTYDIHIANAGDDATKKDEGEKGAGTIVKARQPRLDELVALDLALKKSQPSQMCSGDQKLIWYFLAEPADSKNDGFEYRDLKDRPAIFIEGDPNRPPTLADAKMFDLWQKDDTFADPSGHCLEALYLHELAHHGQENVDWNGSGEEKIARQMGWQPYKDENGKPVDEGYLLKDTEGKQFKFYKAKDEKDTDKWIQTNESGQPIDDKGKVVDADKAMSVTKEAMMDRAAVKPITLYFDNPTEMNAEAMMYMRIGQRWRAHLMRTSPRLYQAVKDQDQNEIDTMFGKGKKVRTPDGVLADDTPEVRQDIAQYEEDSRMYRQWKKEPAKPQSGSNRPMVASAR